MISMSGNPMATASSMMTPMASSLSGGLCGQLDGSRGLHNPSSGD